MIAASIPTLAFVLPVLFVACTVQSAFGFGLALVAVPLLSVQLPLALVTPLLALLSMTLGATIAWRSREAIRFDLGWRLLAGAAAGVPFGIALVVVLDADAVRFALGGTVLVAGLRGLRDERLARRGAGSATVCPTGANTRSVPWTVWPFGLATGVLGGAWNLMGPPLVLFLQRSGLDPSAFRATLHAFALAINAVVVAGWSIGGALSGEGELGRLVWWYFLSMAPLALGGWLGGRIAAGVDVARYRSAVHVLLIVTGSALVLTAVG